MVDDKILDRIERRIARKIQIERIVVGAGRQKMPFQGQRLVERWGGGQLVLPDHLSGRFDDAGNATRVDCQRSLGFFGKGELIAGRKQPVRIRNAVQLTVADNRRRGDGKSLLPRRPGIVALAGRRAAIGQR